MKNAKDKKIDNKIFKVPIETEEADLIKTSARVTTVFEFMYLNSWCFRLMENLVLFPFFFKKNRYFQSVKK